MIIAELNKNENNFSIKLLEAISKDMNTNDRSFEDYCSSLLITVSYILEYKEHKIIFSFFKQKVYDMKKWKRIEKKHRDLMSRETEKEK